ncbi:beta-lactamase-like protein [Mycolicibacterium phlei]|jgi:glyoxylase-like metal-dependent hydrolase (beta-lactamase superfamily II)|uniref:Beta-lactamase n=1 Tax=Mycolicibacterium phlei DSM 43239 = CCUG 21000 TaxID=1226750 RepID=A0A5N5US77_MYCPH|nr:MBL fold metallo-hydrolase [Mycolicibacterium phlei]VEG09458.1 beta-lactamase-like protein [Mycobacteroides chelonae]AMO61343.1 putative quorum-quenching lactonase YtnP [Mycolicibacterium phlei]KAB7752423.1 beta-lactamase [Mycolicibacterium phlei DSM 43239 = CCUG 21000]KXW60771.1 beta-lactamase [Mycolicibacterium phlei DSM 43239 = CCUG 21000]KXW63010.1 beta-lactamase [Mycolicibacterium phlei DSM 43072]
MADRTQLGGATITRVLEWRLDLPLTMFPQTPPTVWQELAPELSPTFWDTDNWHAVVQSWVIEVDGLTVVVDTGVGNGRHRPAMPFLANLQTDFLENLEAAGIPPDSVDVVVNTHIHTDHVGWNTRRENDAWVPTFPNARYLVPEADYRYYHPENAEARGPGRDAEHQARLDASRILFEDSILPVDQAGQIELWSDDYQISESLRLRPAPGHTPGSSVLWLDAGQPAVFVGDLTHSPMQLHRPTDSCVLDENFAEAAATRRQVITEASRRRATVVPAHYPGHGGMRVVARGDGFQIDDWLGISALEPPHN